MMHVDRVRNDGNWIVGDPADTYLRPWKIDGRTVQGVPRLHLYHEIGGGPVPDVPGWKTPRFGFELCLAVDDPRRVMFMEYTPVTPLDRDAPPVQLALFDLAVAS